MTAEITPTPTDLSSKPLSDLVLVSRLRGLLVVEREAAKQIEPAFAFDSTGDHFTDYVRGRIAGYDFAIDAIDTRWPDLPDKFDTMEGI